MSTDAPFNEDSGKKKKKPVQDFPIQEYRLVPNQSSYENESEESSIDLLELINVLWEDRLKIIKYTGIGVFLGFIVALISPFEYESSATLMPEYNTESQGGASDLLQKYGGLIGLGGGSYNASSNAIRVDLYPRIVHSLPFQLKLMEEEFYFTDYDTTVSVFEYFNEVKTSGVLGIIRYIIRIPREIKKAIFAKEVDMNLPVSGDEDSSSIISINKEKMEIVEMLRERVEVMLDEQTGIITVKAKMPEPVVAAKVTQYTIKELTQYLVEYRIEKVRTDLDFVEEQLLETRLRFEKAQLKLAEFRDSNQGALTARAKTEEQILSSEYDLAFGLYNSLSQQYEEAKLRVQEQTPIFKILQPVQVPVEKSEPKRTKIVILFTFFAAVISVLSVVFINRNKLFRYEGN